MVVKHFGCFRKFHNHYFTIFILKLQELIPYLANSCYFAGKAAKVKYSSQTPRFFSIMQLSLQPDRSFKAAANCRLTEKIFAVDADIKLHIVALNSHLADFFASQDILKFHDVQNLAKYIVLVTLNSLWHEIGIHNG